MQLDTQPHKSINTHTHTLCYVIPTLVRLYKMGCKYKQASKLAALTFSHVTASPPPPWSVTFHLSVLTLSPFLWSLVPPASLLVPLLWSILSLLHCHVPSLPVCLFRSFSALFIICSSEPHQRLFFTTLVLNLGVWLAFLFLISGALSPLPCPALSWFLSSCSYSSSMWSTSIASTYLQCLVIFLILFSSRFPSPLLSPLLSFLLSSPLPLSAILLSSCCWLSM